MADTFADDLQKVLRSHGEPSAPPQAATPGSFTADLAAATERTTLAPQDEHAFQAWTKANKITDVDHPDSHYDYRGYWKEHGDKPIRFGVDHFTDTYKQHGHPTFSVESKYSTGPQDGGRWEGDTFIPAGASVFVGPQRPPPMTAQLVAQSPATVTDPPPSIADQTFNPAFQNRPLPVQEGTQQAARGLAILSAKAGRILTHPEEIGPPDPETLNAASDVLEGLFSAATPFVAYSAIKQPIRTALAVFKAAIASEGATAAGEWAGASPELTRLAANVSAAASGLVDVTQGIRKGDIAVAELGKRAGEIIRKAREQRAIIDVKPGTPPAPVAAEPPKPPGVLGPAGPAPRPPAPPVPPPAPPPAPSAGAPSAPVQPPPVQVPVERVLADLQAARAAKDLPAERTAIAELERRGVEVPPPFASSQPAPPVTQMDAAPPEFHAVEPRVAPPPETGSFTADLAAVVETAEPPRKYSSTQVQLPEPLAGRLRALSESIPDEALAPSGREDDPHITVKYGLHTTDVADVRAVLEQEPPITVRLGKTSIFPDTGNGDVLKVDVDSVDLRRLNAKIAAALETTDSHPDYQPHATVAYLKPGFGAAYVDRDDLEGQTITVDAVTFTTPDGEPVTIQLGGTPAAKGETPTTPPVEEQAAQRETLVQLIAVLEENIAERTRRGVNTSSSELLLAQRQAELQALDQAKTAAKPVVERDEVQPDTRTPIERARVEAQKPAGDTAWKDDEDVGAYEYMRSEKRSAQQAITNAVKKARATVRRGEPVKVPTGRWLIDNETSLLESLHLALAKHPAYLATVDTPTLEDHAQALDDILADRKASGLAQNEPLARSLEEELQPILARELKKRAGQISFEDALDQVRRDAETGVESDQKEGAHAEPVDTRGRGQRDAVDGGQLPEPRGAAPDVDREGSGRVLADAPAGDQREPRADAERPRDTPPESLVEGGVRDAAGAGEAPGPLAPTGGGDHPAPTAVSPSGASRDPGHEPLDYALTPERIAAIVDRGAVQRAKDNLAAIQLVKALQAEQRWATADEQDILARYVGWGDAAVAAYLHDSPAYNWSANEKRIWEQVQALSEDERKALRASTTNAHFTFDLYGPIWEALTTAGFGGGRVLEPAVGVGHAIGMMPPTTRANSTITAVELEPLTAAIAGFLYPSATVQATGFQSALVPRGTQDLAISNVPFAKTGVYDPHFEEYLRKPIQNYFFAKALDYMRPGGLVAFITSRYTLDAPTHERFRRYLMDHADFVGAVRLPSQAFDKTAKTEVVTDIIVLRKRDQGETASPNNALFIASEKKAPGARNWKGKEVGDPVYRSTWYDEHPEAIVGEESLSGTMYRSGGYNVSLEQVEALQDKLKAALASILPPGSYQRAQRAVTVRTTVDLGSAKVGELRVGENGGIVVVNSHGELEDATPQRLVRGAKEGEPQTEPDPNAIARVKGLIGIRDARRDLVRLMRAEGTSDAEIKKHQRVLGSLYDQFVKLYGTLNSRTNKMLFAGDPDAAALLALEKLETKAVHGTDKQGRPTLTVTTEVTGRADIFRERTVHPTQKITTVSSPKDALMASLGERAGIDWPFMQEISGASAKKLQAALIDEGLIYEQPDGAFVLAEEYLSGDVVTKLEDAKAAGKRFKRNVEALTPIQPAPKTKADILDGNVSVTLGAGWIEPDIFADFVSTQLGHGEVTVTSTRTTALVKWHVSGDAAAEDAADRHPLHVRYAENRKTYSFLKLVQDTLNLQAPVLGYNVQVGTKKQFIREEEATLAARANQDSVRDLWLQYLYERPELQDRLLEVFNTRYNRTVERQYDGSHLRLPGKVDDSVIRFHPHQMNAVWRILTTGNTLLAHEVGAGKTFEMIAAAMEMKRTGRAAKPMIVVPTYLIGQWRKDIMKLYPDAKLLAFEDKDLGADRRKVAMARIANGNWDIVLVPHSSFGLLSVSSERVQAMYDRWLAELESAIQGADAMNVRQLERVRAALQDKVDKVRTKIEDRATDNALTWEELGVDALFIDEAHAFKNLFFFTEIENIRGLSRSSSDRAIDLFVKVQEINEQSRYRNLVLATATPMMNSMAEVYTMQRYLQPQNLERAGLSQFDLWYAMFAKALPSTEQQPDGSYKEVMRIRDFRNLQLLSKMVRQVMDYVGWEDMPYLDLPKVAGGKVEVVEVQPHPMYPKAKAWFTDRMENIASLPPHIDKRKQEYVAPMRKDALTGHAMGVPDNILTIMNDAKKAAVDIRLIFGDRAKDFPGSRVQAVADRVASIYKAGHKQKLTQLLFLDMGTPKELEPLEFLKGTVVSGDVEEPTADDEGDYEDEDDGSVPPVLEDDDILFNLYGAVKRELERRGIPSREIAFIHQAQNGAERTALFDAMNAGTVRVLFASTDKGGVGMNVQKRLVAIHEIDAPRAGRPGDLRQRMGRGIRQGNMNKEVRLIRYVTKGSTDEWLWGMLVNKDAQIQQFMKGKATHLLEEDLSSKSLEEAQMRSSGDPRGVELVELKGKRQRLAAQAAASASAIATAKTDIVRMTERIRHYTRDKQDLERWVKEKYQAQRGDQFSMKVGRDTFTKREDANTALLAAVRRQVAQDQLIDRPVGEMGTLPIVAKLARRMGVQKQKVVEWTRVELRFNEDAFGGMGEVVSALEHYDGADLETLGAGENLVTQLVNAYERIPTRVKGLTRQIEEAEQKKSASEAAIAAPAGSIAEHTRVVERIAALEKELKLEGEGEQELDEHGKPKPKPKKPVQEIRIPIKSKKKGKKAGSSPSRDGGVDTPSALPDDEPLSMAAGPHGDLPKRPTPSNPRTPLPVDVIIKKLSDLFERVPVSTGHYRSQNARAIYKPKAQTVRAKVANDLYAVAHEFGHHIDLALMDGSAIHNRGAIAQELKTLGAPTSQPSYTAKQQRQEGAAEFFRIWLIEPERLATEAPKYLKEFTRFLLNNPEIHAELVDIRDDVQMYLSLGGLEQVELSVEWSRDSTITARSSRAYERAKDPDERRAVLANLSAQFVDDLAWIHAAEVAMTEGRPVPIAESAYALARLSRGAAAKAEGFLRYGVRNKDGQIQGIALDAAIAPVMGDFVNFNLYLKAKHAADMRTEGLVSGLSADQIDDVLQRTDSPEFQTAAARLAEFQRTTRRYMVEAGIWSADQVRAMEKRWPHYVPMKRVMEAAGAAFAGRRGLANQPKGPKRLKGSGLNTYPAVANIIQNTYEMVAAAEQNKAMLELVKMAIQHKGGGRWLEEIPTPQVATLFNLAAIEAQIRDDLGKAGIVLPQNFQFDDLAQVWTPRQLAQGGKHFVTVVDRGKVRWFQVHEPGLYDAITAMGPQVTGEAVKLFAIGAQTLRKFATATLGFVLRNPTRDVSTAVFQSRSGFTPVDFLRGLFSTLKKDEDFQLFLHSGAGHATLVSSDRNQLNKRLADLGKTKLQQFLSHTVLGPIDGLQALSEVLEHATRVGEFKRTLRKQGRDEAGILQGGLNARDVSQDFARAGRVVREWNRYTAFFSATVGGYTRLYQAIQEGGGGGKMPPGGPPGQPPGGATGGFGTPEGQGQPGLTGAMWKGLMLATLSVLLWVLHRDDEEYRQLPAWERNAYWHIRVPTGFIKIIKPFEIGQIFGTAPEIALDWLYARDPGVVNRLPDRESATKLVMMMTPTLILPWVQVAANYDFFRNRAIVNPYDTDLEPALQYNRWTSGTAKALGRWLNLSPAKLETLAYGYVAGVGRGVATAVDQIAVTGVARPSGGLEQWPGIGAFYRGFATADAQILTDFYEARDALNGAKGSIARYKQSGNMAEAHRLTREHADLLARATAIHHAERLMTAERKKLTAVYANPHATPDQKRQQLDRIYKRMQQIAARALRTRGGA